MSNFIKRVNHVRSSISPFCLGIDPSENILKAWKLPINLFGLRAFCDLIKDSLTDIVKDKILGIVKLQSAFFERFGGGGFTILCELSEFCRNQGLITILDSKRCDIPNTLSAYVLSALDDCGVYADAMTFIPFMGINVFDENLLQYIYQRESFIFVVVRSSNPEGSNIQNSITIGGVKLSEYIMRILVSLNIQKNVFGAVIGSTIDKQDVHDLINISPEDFPFLVPGIGAQGSSYEEVAMKFGHNRNIIPVVSRSVLGNIADSKKLREAIAIESLRSRSILVN